MRPTISIIMPTCGRPTLERAISSVVPQLLEGDEVLVVGDGRQPAARKQVDRIGDARVHYFEHGPTGFLGNAQRNFAQSRAQGDWLSFLDDDDLYLPGALDAIRRAGQTHPGRPLMFRIRCLEPPWEKWIRPEFANENISGGSFVLPNLVGRIPEWPAPDHPLAHWSDRVFIEACLALWPEGAEALVWCEELIYHVPKAHNNAP